MDSKTLVIEPAEPMTEVPAELADYDAEIRPDGALAITYRYGQQSVAEMIERFRAAGGRIEDLRTEEADLEDVFLALTYNRQDA